jgi:hypothetical protein
MLDTRVRHTSVLDIIGDVIRGVALGDLADLCGAAVGCE